MPVTLEPRENGHVMCFTVTEPWDIQELVAPVNRYYEYLASASHTVHAFYDLRDMHSFPSGMFNIRRLIRPNVTRNDGYRIIVGVTGLAQTLVKAVFALGRAPNVTFFTSEDAAWAFVRAQIAHESQHDQPAQANGQR